MIKNCFAVDIQGVDEGKYFASCKNGLAAALRMRENAGMLRCCTIDSPLGPLCLAAEADAIVGLWMAGQRFFGEPYGSLPSCGEPSGVAAEAVAWLAAYWAGLEPSPSALSLAPRGTAFRQRVWRALAEIPYGETCSYGELAVQLGSSPRAVGGAVGHNPISIIIPCHRVTGAGGALTGYAGGTARQHLLLEHERSKREPKKLR